MLNGAFYRRQRRASRWLPEKSRREFALAAILCAFGVISSPSCFAASEGLLWRPSLVGIGTFAKYTTSTNSSFLSTGSKLGLGGGLLLEAGFGPDTDGGHNRLFGIELGALYVERAITLVGVTDRFRYLQVPLQFRVWPLSFLVLGAGGYYASAIGSLTEESGSQSLSKSYESAGYGSSDLGLLISGGVRIPIASSVRWLTEARYSFGLQDLNSPSLPDVTTRWNDFQILLGLGIDLD